MTSGGYFGVVTSNCPVNPLACREYIAGGADKIDTNIRIVHPDLDRVSVTLTFSPDEILRRRAIYLEVVLRGGLPGTGEIARAHAYTVCESISEADPLDVIG